MMKQSNNLYQQNNNQIDSFIFYKSYYEAIKDMDESTQLQLFKAICEFSFYNNKIKLNGISSTLFKLIEPQIIANNKRRISGVKGGRPPKNKNELDMEATEDNTNVYDGIQTYEIDTKVCERMLTDESSSEEESDQNDEGEVKKPTVIRKRNRRLLENETDGCLKNKPNINGNNNINGNYNINNNKNINNNIIGDDFLKKDKIKNFSNKASQYLKKIVETKKNIKVTPSQLTSWSKDIVSLLNKLNGDDDSKMKRIEAALKYYKENYHHKYCPVIESGSSLKQKFTKLEDFIERNSDTSPSYYQSNSNNQIEDQYIDTVTKAFLKEKIGTNTTKMEEVKKNIQKLKDKYEFHLQVRLNYREERKKRTKGQDIGGAGSKLPEGWNTFRDCLMYFTEFLKYKNLDFYPGLYSPNNWAWKEYVSDASEEINLNLETGESLLQSNQFTKREEQEIINMQIGKEDLLQKDTFEEELLTETRRCLEEGLSPEEEEELYNRYGKDFPDEDEEGY